MTRLVTSGCSFTNYCWPTWADYLSYYFQDYTNVGNAGSDNANIARNVLQTAKSGDMVVILWSGWHRQNFWREEPIPTPRDKNNHWDFHWIEQQSRSWLTEFYHPIDRAIISMDYISMVDTHSKLNAYTVFHFSAFNWLTGELEKTPHPLMERMIDGYSITNNFLNNESMAEFRENNKKFVKCYDTKYNSSDRHPGPLCHYEFLTEKILPKLDINPDYKMQKAAEKHEAMVDNNMADVHFNKNEI